MHVRETTFVNAKREEAFCKVEMAEPDPGSWKRFLKESIIAMSGLLLGPAHQQFKRAIEVGATTEDQLAMWDALLKSKKLVGSMVLTSGQLRALCADVDQHPAHKNLQKRIESAVAAVPMVGGVIDTAAAMEATE